MTEYNQHIQPNGFEQVFEEWFFKNRRYDEFPLNFYWMSLVTISLSRLGYKKPLLMDNWPWNLFFNFSVHSYKLLLQKLLFRQNHFWQKEWLCNCSWQISNRVIISLMISMWHQCGSLSIYTRLRTYQFPLNYAICVVYELIPINSLSLVTTLAGC